MGGERGGGGRERREVNDTSNTWQMYVIAN